jgi:hypothetical protein
LWLPIKRCSVILLYDSLNADTSWLLSVADTSNPSKSPRGLNIIIDPWLVGWQTDYHAYFSRQKHVIPPCVNSIAELETQLPEHQTVNAILVCHPFTDHCSKETLRTASPKTRVIAHHAIVNKLLKWLIFDSIHSMPIQGKGKPFGRVEPILVCSMKEEDGYPHVAISALYVPSDRFEVVGDQLHGGTLITISVTPPSSSEDATSKQLYYILYTPHGTYASSLQGWIDAHPDAQCLALIHGFDEIDNPWYLGACSASELVNDITSDVTSQRENSTLASVLGPSFVQPFDQSIGCARTMSSSRLKDSSRKSFEETRFHPRRASTWSLSRMARWPRGCLFSKAESR